MTSKLIFIVVLLAGIAVCSFSVEAANNDETMEQKQPSSEETSGKEAPSVKQLGNLVGNVADKTTKAIEHTVTATTDNLQSATDELTKGVEKSSSHTSTFIKERSASVTEVVHSTTEKIEEVPILEPVAKTVEPTVQSTLEMVNKVVENTTDAVVSTVNTTTNATNETVKGTGKLVQKTSKETGGILRNTLEKTAGAAEEITKPTQETIEPTIQKEPIVSSPVQELESPVHTEKGQQEVETPASPERLIEQQTNRSMNKHTETVEQMDAYQVTTVPKPTAVQEGNSVDDSAKIAGHAGRKTTVSVIYEPWTSLQTVPLKRVDDNYHVRGHISSVAPSDSKKQSDEQTILKQWTTVYTVPAPSQVQQSAPVMQGNHLFSGVVILLGAVLFIALY